MHYKHGLFAGSFDPITEGHLDIIQRAIPLCDKLTVGVFINSEKKCMFSVEERVAKIKEEVRDFPTVDVISNDGFTCLYAKEHGCDVLIRGYRNQTDLAYEQEICEYNYDHAQIPTLLLQASPHLRDVSSSAVREKLQKERKKS